MTPKIIKTTPLIIASRIEVCTARLASAFRPAPRSWATTTLAPTDRPTNRLTSRLISAVLEPTAARDAFPQNWPTTTTSAALNRSCSRLEAISGSANSRILLASVPLHISIS